jgi:histidine ammonia-lyase
MVSPSPLVLDSADMLDADACRQLADGRRVELSPRLLEQLAHQRRAMLDRLDAGGPVYGVSTGMGAASTVALTDEQRSAHQARLLVARAAGSAPWLDARHARAALAVRLRTFLAAEAGVSAELCSRLVEVLNAGLAPAVPATRLGSAGEIIALAHLGAAVVGAPHGEFLAPDAAGRPGGRPVAPASVAPTSAAPTSAAPTSGAPTSGARSSVVPAPDAGVSPFALGAKEGVAFIEGVPVSTGRAILLAADARRLVAQQTAVVAAELVLLRANRDPYRAAVARADAQLARILADVRGLAGPPQPAASLQSPVSLRVSGTALAHLVRSLDALDAAIARALDGVTDSPALLEREFVGTAGFDAFDLAATIDAVRFAVLHVTELGAVRIHRLLDDRVTGLGRQLSPEPGVHAGMVTVHKRAVGTVHALLTSARPASLGLIETSLGQEDAQSFSLEAAEALDVALDGGRDVLACELLALIQARRLRRGAGTSSAAGADDDGADDAAADAADSAARPVDALLDELDALVPDGTDDRPWGRDVLRMREAVEGGWALRR